MNITSTYLFQFLRLEGKNRSFFCFLICLLFFCVNVHAQSARLKFSDLNLGVDCHFTSYQDSANPVRYNNQAIGFSGRYQTSVVANLLNKGKNKRFQIVDVIAGEMAFGLFQSEDPENKEPLWFNFRFDLGLGILYRLNQHHDLGINWIMMRFSNDDISTYVSGSELQARYRYKKCSIELGTANRHVRVGGFSETYLKKKGEGNLTSFGFRYLINEKRNVGLRLEAFDLREEEFTDRILNCRVFYGYYF